MHLTLSAGPPTAQAFRDVIGRFASGVTVITTALDGTRLGTTASAVTSLSLEPPMLLVCMNQSSATGRAIAQARAFAVNILGEDHGDVARAFAQSGIDKFAGVPTAEGPRGLPMLGDALAQIACRVVDQVRAATHVVFLGEVEHASARPGAPLAYYRGEFGRLQLGADDAVVAGMRALILAGRLAAGTHLVADDLAAELHAGRGSVLHALSRLESDGFVARDGRDGFVVRALDTAALRDAAAAREAIELGAVEASIERANANEVAELRRRMDVARRLAADATLDDVDAWIAADAAFHERAVALAGSEALLQAYRSLGLWGPAARALRMEEHAAPDTARDHERLVEAFETRDADAARRAVREHARRPRELRTMVLS